MKRTSRKISEEPLVMSQIEELLWPLSWEGKKRVLFWIEWKLAGKRPSHELGGP